MSASDRIWLRLILSSVVVAGSAGYVLMRGDFASPLAAAESEVDTVGDAAAVPSSLRAKGNLVDGLFRSKDFSAYYGLMAVKITVEHGVITTVKAFRFPKDRKTSADINKTALPVLYSEAIAAQDSKVDVVTGATYTSQAFAQALQNAIDKAASAETAAAQ